MGDVERVHVFFDWQNVYMRAREAFHAQYDPHFKGQVNPADLAHLLASRGSGETERHLERVHIYRGEPDQRFDVKGYAAARRQMTAWTRGNNLIVVHKRTLKGYPDNPHEKGVDVALAVDVVTGAADGAYDTAIIMSADTDLVPALEYVERLRVRNGGPRTEVAMWRGDYGRRASRISIGNKRPYCHWLDQQDYWGLQDETDYSASAQVQAPGRPTPGHWIR